MKRRFISFTMVAIVAVLVLGGTGCAKKTPQEQLQEALELLQQQQSSRAVLKMQDILKNHPEDAIAADVHLLLARYYVTQGNAERALEHLQDVAESTTIQDPRYSEAINGIVQVRRQIGETAEAVELLDEVIAELSAEDTMGRAGLELQKAEVLLQWDEGTTRGLQLLGRLMIESEEASARGAAREMLANYYRSQEDYATSNAVYREYLDAFPEDSIRTEIELAIAMNRFRMGEEEAALEDFEQLAQQYREQAEKELDPARRTQMLVGLSQMFARVEQYDRAEELLRQIMEENKMADTAIDAQFQIANMYILAGLQKQDEQLFQRGKQVLEQITMENPATSIEETATRQIAGAQQAWQQVTSGDGATTPSLETPDSAGAAPAMVE